jgi:hypothetical protein
MIADNITKAVSPPVWLRPVSDGSALASCPPPSIHYGLAASVRRGRDECSGCKVPVRGAAVLASALGCGAVVLLGCQLGRPKPGGGLASADPIERVEAIIAAGEAHDVSAVPLLVDRLEDEDEAVRFYTIQALTRITGQDMGYRYYEPSWERARAVRRWRGFLERRAASGPATRPAD